MRRLVIVRPEPGASATAVLARRAGLDPVVVPLFAVEPVRWTGPDPRDFDALLLTSANAIRHGGAQLRPLKQLPAWCVGEATATAAREAGFKIAGTGNSSVEALLEKIPGDVRLLHLCGEHRRDLSGRVRHVIVYRSAAIEPPPALAGIEGAVVAAHSPRAAAMLAQRAHEQGLRTDSVRIAAISKAAAQSAGAGWEEVASALEPSDAALLSLAHDLCDKP